MEIRLLLLLLFAVPVLCNATNEGMVVLTSYSSVIQSDSLKRKVDTVAVNLPLTDTTKTTITPIPKKEQRQKDKPSIKDENEAQLKPEVKRYDNHVDTVKQLRENVFRVEFRGNLYDYVIVNLQKSDVKLCWKDTKGNRYNNLRAVIKDTMLIRTGEVELAANAGMYTTETDPQGLYIEEGKEYKHVDTVRYGNGDNFHLKPNGIFYIDTEGAHIDTTEFFITHVKHRVEYATQSGPMLIINGAIHYAFKEGSQNLNIRNGVGIMGDKRVVFVISVGSTNFYDFAALFKYHLKCNNALYLDGAISKMYVPGLRDEDTGGHFGPILLVTKRRSK